MHHKNTNFCIKNAEFFRLKNRHFFEFFLTKNVLAKNVRKHLKIRFVSQKLQLKLRYYRKSIAKYIVILSQFCDIIIAKIIWKISENCDKNCEFFITKGNAFCMGVTLLPEGPVYFYFDFKYVFSKKIPPKNPNFVKNLFWKKCFFR